MVDFDVLLPQPKTTAAPSKPGRVKRAPRKAKVLCVEDNEWDAFLIQACLQTLPQVGQVWRAPSGQAALTLLEENQVRPDLILADINMPGLNGFDLLSKLRGRPKTQRTRVAMLTQSSDGADFHRSLIRSACTYIVKPSTLNELQAVLGELIARTLHESKIPSVLGPNDVEADARTMKLAAQWGLGQEAASLALKGRR
ncbi:MAG: response regulator [Pseudomonadota bacterium]